MIYLSGCTSPSYEQDLIDLGVGLLIQPGSYMPSRAAAFGTWAADNGCYPPERPWSCAKWARMLGAIDDAFLPPPLFCLVPDVPFDHTGTLKRFWHYFAIVEAFGYRAAFAIQDGATVDTVPWGAFYVAFLAGSTEWKMGEQAYEIALAARKRGKWVHMGRVNSWDRLDWASRIGCDSADGTFMRYGKPQEMVARLKVWLDKNSPRLTQKAATVGEASP